MNSNFHNKRGKNFKKIIKSGILINLLKIRLLGKSTPIIVSWKLTNDCNQRCLNCHFWQRKGPELETAEVLSKIDMLHSAGVRFINFTGGEPLIRKDISEIINFAAAKDIYIGLNTNGVLLREKIDCLKNINELRLSLDGTKEVNDFQRGNQSFEHTLSAIALAKEYDVPVYLTMVLTKLNLDCIDFIISFAQTNNIRVGFQPAALTFLGDSELNSLSPVTKKYKEAIAYLIKLKRKKYKCILNSVMGLEHIMSFPEAKKMPCVAGRLICRVETDGSIVACPCCNRKSGKLGKNEKLRSIIDKKTMTCTSCWRYNLVELNLISAFKIEPILNVITSSR